jgi:hypothetical protein
MNNISSENQKAIEELSSALKDILESARKTNIIRWQKMMNDFVVCITYTRTLNEMFGVGETFFIHWSLDANAPISKAYIIYAEFEDNLRKLGYEQTVFNINTNTKGTTGPAQELRDIADWLLETNKAGPNGENLQSWDEIFKLYCSIT